MIANPQAGETVWYRYVDTKLGKVFVGRIAEILADFKLILHDGKTVMYYNNPDLENVSCLNLNHRR